MSAEDFCENSQVATMQKFAEKKRSHTFVSMGKRNDIVIYQSEDGLVRMEACAAIALKIL